MCFFHLRDFPQTDAEMDLRPPAHILPTHTINSYPLAARNMRVLTAKCLFLMPSAYTIARPAAKTFNQVGLGFCLTSAPWFLPVKTLGS